MTVTEDNLSAVTAKNKAYAKEIKEILDANDLSRLSNVLSLEQGLADNEIRERAWPLMIKVNEMKIPPYKDLRETHKDEEQVMKDVDRSFFSLTDEQFSSEQLQKLRTRLQRVIFKVLVALPDLNYYQGYHDIASIVVLVFSDDEMAYQFLYCLSLRYLRDHMMKNIDPTMKQLVLIPELVKKMDPEIYEIIRQIQPVYALSSIISLFTHDISSVAHISVIWDFVFFKDDPQLVIYIYAALLIYYKEDILIELNEMSDSSLSAKSADFDLDVVHAVLNRFIRGHLNINSIDSKHELENVLRLAIKLHKRHPLSTIKNFKYVSNYSFLKRKTSSLLILALQSKETESNEARNQKRQLHSRKLVASKQVLLNGYNGLKISLGVGILGLILHTTLRSSSIIRPGIGIEVSRHLHLCWDSIIDSIRQ